MTLIVSVLVEDGIILASDSVTTLNAGAAQGKFEPTTIKAFPNPPKIFPFFERFGIGIWNQDSIDGKPAYLAIRELEDRFKADSVSFNTVDEVAQTIGEAMAPMEKENDLISLFVAGYTGQNAKIVLPLFGISDDSPLALSLHRMGSHAFGEIKVVASVERLYEESGDPDCPPFRMFSLQTAVDYAVFLIRTTTELQQFSRRASTVGGAINVAVVTHLDGFRWIQQQPISPISK